MTNSTSANGSTYTATKVMIGKKTEYNVLVVTGKFNYVSVRKLTANPFGMLGTDFKNFDEAISHYKNPQMKIELFKIEMGLS